MTLEQIKATVQAGGRVFCGNRAYEVIKDSLGQWLIKCSLNGSCIGLTWQDGVTLNGPEEWFFAG